MADPSLSTLIEWTPVIHRSTQPDASPDHQAPRFTRGAIVGVTVAALGLSFALPAGAAADTTAPSVPGSINTAYYGGVGTVIKWGKVSASDLANYIVYRSTSKTIDPAKNAIATPTTLTYTDTAALAGSTVYYAIAAKDKTGNVSKPSSLQTVKTTDTAAPSTPSGLKATASSTGIALDWSDVTAVDLAGYKVSRSSSSSGTYTVLATVTASAYSDTTAPAGVASYYKISAVDKTGNSSGTTSAASATRPAGATPPATAPAAPAGVKATPSTSAASITLSWTASTGATGYTVSRATTATGQFTKLGTATGTSYTDATAPSGATSYYQVVATNAVGSSAPAAASATTVKDTTAPATPSSPKAVLLATGGMSISWSANNEADLAGYRVLKRNGDSVYVAQLGGTTPYTATTFNDATVTEGKVAYFRIYAIDTSGNISSYVSLTANNPNVAPKAPASLKATASTTAGINLSWAAPTDKDVAGYSIFRSIDAGKTYPLLTTVTAASVGAAPAFADTSAPQGIKAAYKISAQDVVGNISAASTVVTATSTTAPVDLPVITKVITVGPTGQFPTITAALATIPDTNLDNYEIDIAPGSYHEKIELTAPHVSLVGMGGNPQDTVLTYDAASGTIDPTDGQPYGTAGSYTLFVNAANDKIKNLSVVNAFDEAAHPEITSQQAVALRVEGDRFVADTVRLIGNQDTLLADTPKPTTRIRQYYVNSFIEGDVDYIFGAADAVFDRDTLHSLNRGKSDNGAITAASTDTGSKYGFLFTDSKVVSDAAAGTVHLGRPWHPSADPNAIASVVWKNTWLPAAIAVDQPWEDMATADSTGTKVNFTWQSARFSEYLSIGPGATLNANRPQLTASTAANATPAKYLAGSDGWNPVQPTVTAAPAAPVGLQVTPDNRVANLSWTDDPSAAVIGWKVLRTDNTGTTVTLATVNAPSYSDTTAANGATYSYSVAAVNRAGTQSPASAPITVTIAAAALVADLTVDPANANGSNVFATLGAALAAAPAGTAANPTVISVVPGKYAEYLTVSKPYVVFVGSTGKASDVVITGNRASGTPIPGAPANPDGTPATYGTSGSATLVITGTGDQLRDLTVENAYREGTYTNGQAVALRTTGDKLVFEDIRLLGNQDTLYANSAGTTTAARQYFHNCYIEGDVDFLFGRATAVFDNCTLKALEHGTSPNGAVTAASTDKSQKYGFLITGSRIIGTAPDGSENLGRPWQPGITQADGTSVADTNAIAQVVVRDSWLGPVVSTTQTWTNMVNSGTTTSWTSARFFEFGNTGPGAGTSATRPQLTDAQAADYTAADYLAGSDGWNPVADDVNAAPAAVTGLTVGGDDNVANLSWNDNTEANVTGYRVYRSQGATVSATEANLVATVFKPSYTDTTVDNGTQYSYTVQAIDAAGDSSPAAAAVTVVPAPKPLVADITVAADGSGDYTTVQAGINAAPAGTSVKPTVVFIRPGTYREVVSITKPYLILKGTTGNAADVVLTYDNANGTAVGPTTCPAVTTAATCGTSGSATVSISSANITVRDLTIANGFVAAKHPEIGNFNTQAVALKATADKQVYNNVRLLGVQDTLLADSSGNISSDGSGYARQYYVNSFIEGNVDFVFGRADAVFDRDTFHATAHSGGTIFAPSTASKAKGYLLYASRIESDNDSGTFYLGRPWRAFTDGAYADNSRGQTVLVNTWMNDGFDLTHPWTDFAPNVWSDGRFAEIGTTGPGAAVNANRPQLTSTAGYTPAAWLAGTDGWNPVLAATADVAPSAPANVVAAAGDTKVSLSWNESTEADVVGYHVYRNGKLVSGTLTRGGYIDGGLVNGTAVSYTVTAVDAAGHESAQSANISATPVQKIDAIVASDGSGSFTSLQAAVDADPGTGPWVIKVQPGSYSGATSISKSNITIEGATGTAGDVVLTNGTASPTLTISGSGVTVQDLTVQNTNGGNGISAVYMYGDKILLTDTNLVGKDRTVWADVPTAGAVAKQLIENSTITGNSNIVLGRATLVIHGSTIVPALTSGTVFIPSTTANGGNGFLVIGSTIAPAAGVSDVRLGGGYSQGTTTAANAPQAVIRDTVLNAGIKSQPWQDFNGYKWTDARFAEYNNTGAGATVSDLRPQLSPADSVKYTVSSWLGTGSWYPAVADPAAPTDVTAPAAASQLAAVAGDKTVALTWTAPADADLAGYRLYRSTTSPVAPSYATLVSSSLTGTSYTATGLTDGTAYYFALVALDAAGNTATAATASATPADSAPPAAPAGVKAGVGDSRVVLTWTGNTEPDLAGYRVYRDGSTTPVNAALLTGSAFTDSSLTNGTSYSYVVTAVDSAGNESTASAAVTASPAPGDNTAPAVPAGPVTVLGKGSVTVNWAAGTDPDLASYTVYRSASGAAATKVATVTVPTYTDTAVVIGTAYSYTVTATDTAGNESAPSAAAAVTPIKVDLVVAADGSGDATTVAAGIALLADNADYTAQGGRTILVKPGTYSGVVASGNRYGVNIVGATNNAADTVITAGATAAVATLTLSGPQWTLTNLTVANTNGATTSGAQATALQVKSGDKDVFKNVRFLGDKQTLLLSTANVTTFSREYFSNVYVEGGADMVLGRAVAVFDNSTFHVLNRPGASLTDSSVDAASTYGFLISNSKIVTDGNPGSIYLGRPYSTQGKAQVVIRNTDLGAAIVTAKPWNDYDTNSPWTAGRFFEYQNTGAGAVITNPATRPQLSDTDAVNYTAKAYLAGTDGWNPTGS